MVNFSQYIFYISDNLTTNDFHTKEVASIKNENNVGNEARIAIIPLSRQANIFDTPGELLVDKKTGDLSIVTEIPNSDRDGYKVIDITKDLKFELKKLENTLDQLRKSTNIYSEKVKALEYALPFIKVNNQNLELKKENLKEKVNTLYDDFNQAKASNKLIGEKIIILGDTYNAFNEDIDNTIDTLFNMGDYYLDKSKELKTKIITDHNRHLDMMSTMGKIMYNARSIMLVAIPKVDKDEFKRFKENYEGMLLALQLTLRLKEIATSTTVL